MDSAAIPQAPAVTSLPRIGDPAPQFTADTTFGTLKLEDFRGSWLILFPTRLISPRSAPPSSSPLPRSTPNCGS